MSTPTNLDPSLRAIIDGLVSTGEFDKAAKFAQRVIGETPAAGVTAAAASSAPSLRGEALLVAAKAEGRLLTFNELRRTTLSEMSEMTSADRPFVERSVAALGS